MAPSPPAYAPRPAQQAPAGYPARPAPPAPAGYPARPAPPSNAARPAQTESGRSLSQLTGSIQVGINALGIGRAGEFVITYGLGSCIGVALYDPARRIGGIVHFMLANGASNPRGSSEPLMFGDSAIPAFFEAFRRAGGDLGSAFVYVAGGASVANIADVFDIGGRNIRVAHDTIAAARLRIRAEEVGGRASRTLSLDLSTGNVLITTPGLAARRLA